MAPQLVREFRVIYIRQSFREAISREGQKNFFKLHARANCITHAHFILVHARTYISFFSFSFLIVGGYKDLQLATFWFMFPNSRWRQNASAVARVPASHREYRAVGNRKINKLRAYLILAQSPSLQPSRRRRRHRHGPPRAFVATLIKPRRQYVSMSVRDFPWSKFRSRPRLTSPYDYDDEDSGNDEITPARVCPRHTSRDSETQSCAVNNIIASENTHTHTNGVYKSTIITIITYYEVNSVMIIRRRTHIQNWAN